MFCTVTSWVPCILSKHLASTQSKHTQRSTTFPVMATNGWNPPTLSFEMFWRLFEVLDLIFNQPIHHTTQHQSHPCCQQRLWHNDWQSVERLDSVYIYIVIFWPNNIPTTNHHHQNNSHRNNNIPTQHRLKSLPPWVFVTFCTVISSLSFYPSTLSSTKRHVAKSVCTV